MGAPSIDASGMHATLLLLQNSPMCNVGYASCRYAVKQRAIMLHANMLSSKGQSTISKELRGRVAGVVVEVD